MDLDQAALEQTIGNATVVFCEEACAACTADAIARILRDIARQAAVYIPKTTEQ